MRRSEARIGELETRLRDMETRSRRAGQENAKLRERLARGAEDGRAVIDRQAAAIEELRGRLEARTAGPGPEDRTAPGTNDFTRAVSSQPAPGKRAPAASDATPAVPMIQEFENDADPAGDKTPLIRDPVRWGPGCRRGPMRTPWCWPARTPWCWPARTPRRASPPRGEPRPVLLRLTGPARSAAEGGEALEVDVAGCTLTGAGYGDLSSEKVYVRLRTLTCAGPARGTVTETQVAGFVAGSGKVGVRGPVVSREGALVEKAFLAGLISGVGETAANLLQAPARTTSTEP